MRSSLFILSLLLAFPAQAEIFHSRESALEMAFPLADSIESHALVLNTEQVDQIEERSGTRIESRIVNVYTAHQDGAVSGYAFFDTHDVRSLPETILVVIDASGVTRGVHLLAFHEPAEYQPSKKWLAQFTGLSLDPELALRRGVAGIAGSTLTATAITASVRRILATHEVSAPSASPVLSAAVHRAADRMEQ